MTQQPDTAVDLSASNEWSTPPDLFAALAAMYGSFGLDVAASERNHKAGIWFDWERSALNFDWNQWWSRNFPPLRAFMNPPYSRGMLDAFMARARAETLLGHVELVTCLVPHYTDCGWWHDNVEAPAGLLEVVTADTTILGPRTQTRWTDLTVEVLRLRGRVRFIEASGATGPARFPSAVVTFARPGVLPLRTVGSRRTGQAFKVDARVERIMRDLVDAGLSISEACKRAGVARKTWYRYLERKGRAA